MKDFDFLAKTVAEKGAAVKAKKLDCSDLRPRQTAIPGLCVRQEHVRERHGALRLWATATRRDRHEGGGPAVQVDGLFGGGCGSAGKRAIMLRRVMKGHALEKALPLGSTLSRSPASRMALMEREKRRITRYQGSSSDHSHLLVLGNASCLSARSRSWSLCSSCPI